MDDALSKRIEIIPKGERSKVICHFLNQYCEKMEAKQTGTKAKKIWFDKKIKPFILNYAGNRDLFSLIENEGLRTAFKEAGITISDADIKLCIEQIIIEGEE
jgi:hypothetical protein